MALLDTIVRPNECQKWFKLPRPRYNLLSGQITEYLIALFCNERVSIWGVLDVLVFMQLLHNYCTLCLHLSSVFWASSQPRVLIFVLYYVLGNRYQYTTRPNKKGGSEIFDFSETLITMALKFWHNVFMLMRDMCIEFQVWKFWNSLMNPNSSFWS